MERWKFGPQGFELVIAVASDMQNIDATEYEVRDT